MEKNGIKTITNGKINWNGDGHVQHVGIVEKVENDKVCTIEGNSKDEVRNKNYSLTNKSIYGYGSIN